MGEEKGARRVVSVNDASSSQHDAYMGNSVRTAHYTPTNFIFKDD